MSATDGGCIGLLVSTKPIGTPPSATANADAGKPVTVLPFASTADTWTETLGNPEPLTETTFSVTTFDWLDGSVAAPLPTTDLPLNVTVPSAAVATISPR